MVSDRISGGFRPSDWLRTQPVRSVGYAHEIAKAGSQYVPPHIARYCTLATGAYIAVDTFDKSAKGLTSTGGGIVRALVAGGDAFLWQNLASVIIPGVVFMQVKIHATRAISAPWGGPAVTLLAIALLMKPIDLISHGVMNLTYRLILGRSYQYYYNPPPPPDDTRMYTEQPKRQSDEQDVPRTDGQDSFLTQSLNKDLRTYKANILPPDSETVNSPQDEQ